MTFLRTSRFCMSVALAGMAGASSGAGVQLLQQNASGLGNAYAGQAAAAEDASTIYFNPAAMTRLPGNRITVAAVAIRPSAKFSDSGGSFGPDGMPVPAGGSNGGDAGGWNYLPVAYFSGQLTPSLWAGVGLTAPFGLKSEYDRDFIGRYQSQEATLQTYNINPSIAYKLSDTLSLGAGVNYQHVELELNRSTFVGVETASSQTLSDSQWGWNAGVLFSPTPDTGVGISYRSGTRTTLSGPVQVVGVPGFPTTESAKVHLPATTSIALSQRLSDRWQALGDFTYTHWSSIKDVPVVLADGTVADTLNFQFRNSWRVGLGANFNWSPDTILKFGVAYEISPVTDEYRMTMLPETDLLWVGFGARMVISRKATVDLGYAHAFMQSGEINQAHGVGVLGQGAVVGSYRNSADILAVQLNYAF